MKRIIQICSLFGLLILFTAVSANAQTSTGTDIEIPFAFSIGDKSYDAGHYIVKVNKLPNGIATLFIQDTKTEKAQTLFLNDDGGAVGAGVKLVFDTVAGQRYLSRVQTPERSFAVVGGKTRKDNNAKLREASVASTGSGASLF